MFWVHTEIFQSAGNAIKQERTNRFLIEPGQ